MPLTPPERILLISEIGTRLGSEEWSTIDLILRQFSLPTTEEWSSDRRAYVMEMIDKADDDDLLNLGQHVGYIPQNEPSLSQNLPDFWERGRFRLFLSHLANRRKVASKIKEELSSFGISTFVAHNDIEPTKEWQNEIESALTTCDALLALLHPGFHESNWTDQEIGYAMGRGVPIVTVHLGTEPYGFIGKFQAIVQSKLTPSTLASKLFAILARHPRTRQRISTASVYLFSDSESFAMAKERMDVLERLDYWDEDLSAKARSAKDENRQIGEAWDVPERLERLIASKSSTH